MDQQACIPYDENETYEYKLVKEYNLCDFKNHRNEYFLSWRNNGCYISQISSTGRLKRRRKKDPIDNVMKFVGLSNTTLVVKHIPEKEDTSSDESSKESNSSDST